MTDQEQIDALKVQVNCLREMLTTITTSYGFYTSTVAAINDLIKATPEQCLAEVKARAIEDARDAVRAKVGMNGGTFTAFTNIAVKLREQRNGKLSFMQYTSS